MKELKLGDKCRLKTRDVDGIGIFVGINSYGRYVFFMPDIGTLVSTPYRDDFIVLSSGKNDSMLKSLIDFSLDIKDKEWFLELTSLL